MIDDLLQNFELSSPIRQLFWLVLVPVVLGVALLLLSTLIGGVVAEVLITGGGVMAYAFVAQKLATETPFDEMSIVLWTLTYLIGVLAAAALQVFVLIP